jgi:hypothetical protein
MVNEDTCIAYNSRHGASAMAVNFDELLGLVGDLHELAGGQLLFNAKDYTFACFYTDGGRAELMICVNQIS